MMSGVVGGGAGVRGPATALAAAIALGASGVMCAGEAHADSADDAFLAAVQQTFPAIDSVTLIKGGHHACAQRAGGLKEAQVVDSMVSFGMTNRDADTLLVSAAERTYCPQYIP
jgi:hypothetical protein